MPSVMKKLMLLFIPACMSAGPRLRSPHSLWNMKKLGVPPEVIWLDKKSKVRSLLYKGLNYHNKGTEVFAYYSNPDLINGSAPSGNKFPAVVLVHGGGGRAFPQWVEEWARNGYAAIAMDLSGRDGEGKRLAMAGPDQSAENKFQAIVKDGLKGTWPYHAIADVILAHSFLLGLPEVDSSRTCITGISWGGYLTCMAASLDSRFKAAAPVYGCGFYDETRVFGAYLQDLPSKFRKKWMENFDPSFYLDRAAGKFLFVNSNQDKYYTLFPYNKTCRLIPLHQRTISLKPGMGHSHEAGWAPGEILVFFESVLNNGKPLPRVDSIARSDSALTLFYHSDSCLTKALFYYSGDTTSLNEERLWKVQKAHIDSSRHEISTPYPASGYPLGFFYLEDQNHLSVSSELLINCCQLNPI